MPMTPPDEQEMTPDPDSVAPGASGSGTQVASQDGPAPHVLAALPLQPTIPGYEVYGEIARGGMGAVLSARELALDREVAIKVLLSGTDTPDNVRRFVNESMITARLPHPSIPPVFTLGELPGGSPFLVMKLIRGRTLADLLAERKDPSADLFWFVGIFEQICQAVAFAHCHQIIHRDLKPGNVMVGAFGEVQVMDWGLAKQLVRREETGPGETTDPGVSAPHLSDTGEGMALGTPAYIAPEQARGEQTDERTDVFALGGLLCALLTGKPPFEAGEVRVTLGLASIGEVSAALERLAGCQADPELVALAQRCLNPDPAGRPVDAGEVAAEVASYRTGVEERLRWAEAERAAAAARAEAEAAKGIEQGKLRLTQLMLAAAVGLLMFGVVGVVWWQDRQRTARRADEARLVGERDAERRLKTAQATDGAKAALGLAATLRRQNRFREAETALTQAAELAAGGTSGLTAEVEQATANLAFARELDEIRYRKWFWVVEIDGKGRFNETTAPPAYRAALLARGFDLANSDPAEVAERVATSGIKAELIAALDDWALYEPDRALHARLLDVARRADPGPWTDRLRDPAVRSDAARLGQLAEDADAAVLTPATLVVLAELMRHHQLDPVPLLSAGQHRGPPEFELNFHLGRRLYDLNAAAAAGFYRAANVLRPHNVTVLNNLGAALERTGDSSAALGYFIEAARLDPNFHLAHYNLGVVRYLRRDLDGAMGSFREATRLDPNDPQAHNNLGVVLTQKGELDAAIDSLREAIRLAPKKANAHANLGAAYGIKKQYREAMESAQETIRLDPLCAHGHGVLGTALWATGDIPAARRALVEAARLDPKKWEPVLSQLPAALPLAPPPRKVKR
jgi:Flp pilus assembly protein TadD